MATSPSFSTPVSARGTLSVVAIELDMPLRNQWLWSPSRAKLGKRSALMSPSGVTREIRGSSSNTIITTGAGSPTMVDSSAAASLSQTSSDDREKAKKLTSATTGTPASSWSQVRTPGLRATSQTRPAVAAPAKKRAASLSGSSWRSTADAARNAPSARDTVINTGPAGSLIA